MYLFIEKEMRGGISYIVKRFTKPNNKYIQLQNNNKPSRYIRYLGANNVYGWAMSQYLPYSGFKWLNQKEIDKFCLNLIDENSLIGYILEFDLEYPADKLHELHNNYPLAPEKLEISYNMLSNYCINFANKYGIKFAGANKLISNLSNKSKYCLHYRNQ